VFGISGFEFLIIAGFILLVFGPEKIPDMAKTFGRAMKQFNKAKSDMETVVRMEMWQADQKSPDSPFKPKENPLERLAAATKAQQESDAAKPSEGEAEEAALDAENADASAVDAAAPTTPDTPAASTAPAPKTAPDKEPPVAQAVEGEGRRTPSTVATALFEDDDEDEEEEE
jgi:TatA/E family protein of Tat protein translocase